MGAVAPQTVNGELPAASAASAMPEPRPLRVLFDMVGCTRVHWGGMQEHIHTLARHLTARGHEPMLLVRTDKTYGIDTETRTISAHSTMRCVSDPRLVSSFEHDGTSVWQWMPALYEILRRERIDIYHIHTPQMGNELWSAATAYLAGYSPVMTYHTMLRPESRQRHVAMRFMHRHLRVHTIGVSEAVCACVRQQYDPPAAYINPVLNGVDEPAFLPVPPRTEQGIVTLGVLARLNPDKGVDTLITALSRVKHDTPVRAVILGDGPLEADLRRIARDLGVADRVEFRGYVTDASRLLKQFDAVVIPSRSEAFSLVGAEAYAAGRPVIGTRVGGLVELVREGETGWLVPVGDPAAMARAIEDAARDPERLRRMGAAGRQVFEQRLRADVMVEQTLRVYHTAMRPRARPRA